MRLKTKYWLVILLLLGVAGIGLALASDGELLQQAQKARSEGNRELALVLSDRYLEHCGGCSGAAEVLYRTAVDLTLPPDRYVYIRSDGTRSWHGSGFVPDRAVASAEDRYLRLIKEFPESPHARSAVRNLSTILMYEGRWDEAEDLLNNALNDERLRYGWTGYAHSLIDIAYRRGDLDRAIQLALDFVKEYPYFNPYEVYLILGDIYFEQGLLDEAETWYAQASLVWPQPRAGVGQINLATQGRTISVLEGALDQRASLIEEARLLQQIDGGSVSGHIHGITGLDGRVDVLIGQKDLVDQPIPTRRKAYRLTTPDESGYFRFDDLLPGEYILTLRYHPDDMTLNGARYYGPKPLRVEAGEEVDAGFRIAEAIRPGGTD